MSVKLNPVAQPPIKPAQVADAARPSTLNDMPPVIGPDGKPLPDDPARWDDGFSAGNTRPPPVVLSPPSAQPPVNTRPAPPPSTPAADKPTAPPVNTAPPVEQVTGAGSPRPMSPVAAVTGGLVHGKGAVQQLNSNHPEIITSEGLAQGNVAISTMANGLNHSFNGHFRLFSSNQNRTGSALHQTVALHNPSDKPVTVRVDTWASTTTGEAGYTDTQKNPDGTAFKDRETFKQGISANGPGQFNAARILRGDNELPANKRTLVIPPGGTVTLPSSAVSNRQELITQGDLVSDGPVQAAIVYNKSAPTTEQVKKQLESGKYIGTSGHDKEPTPLDAPGKIIFSRVSGVVETSQYEGRLTNDTDQKRFLVTGAGEQSYAFNTKRGVDLGTGRNEASKVLVRAEHNKSAYESPLNYGAEFKLGGTFHNPTQQPKTVKLYIDSPISSNDSRVMRGSFEVKVRTSPGAEPQKKLITLSQSQQTRGKTPVAEFTLPPGASYEVDLRTIYGANNTGPQTVRVVTSG